MSDKESNNVVVNMDNTNLTDTKDTVGTLAHEVGHQLDKTGGEASADRTATLMDRVWERENKYEGTSGATGTSESQAKFYQANRDSRTVQQGTQVLENIEHGEALTVFVHGTWSSPKDADPQFLKAVGNTFGEKVVQLDWSKDGVIGNSTPVSRTEGAENLLDLVNNYTFLPGEQLNVVDHSHGGNVTKEFTQLYSGDKKIDNLVLLGTPQRSDYKLDTNDLAPNAKVINVYDKNDVIQVLGGQTPVSGGRRMENAYNIPVFQYKNQTINTDNDSRKLGFPSQVVVPLSIGPVKSHTELDSKPVWDKAVVPLLRKPTLPSNYRQPELKPIPIEVK